MRGTGNTSRGREFDDPTLGDAPDAGDTFERVTGRWSARSTATVGLILGAGFAAIAVERALGASAMSPGVGERVVLVLDAMTLTVGVLALAATVARNAAGPSRNTVALSCVLALLVSCILPTDVAMQSPNLTAIAVASAARLAVLAVAMSALRPGPRPDGTRTWMTKTLVSTALLAVLLRVFVETAADPAEVARFFFASHAAIAVVVALAVGAAALRHGRRDGIVLAFVLIGLGVADGHTTLLSGSELSTTAGKAMRLVVTVAVLFTTVLELLDVAIGEHEKATLARAESERAADRLVAEMSYNERFVHDARNALLAIQGGVRRLGRDHDEPMAAAISSEVDRLRDMLERDDRLPITFDVVAALQPMVQCYRATLSHIELAASGPVYARGRPSIAAEVAQNLIENAIRHGGGDVVVWIHQAGPFAEVRVADRGEGIDSDRKTRLFERGQDSASGSGVGLSISRRLIERQGGSMWVEDRDGGGTIVSFQLPSPGMASTPRHEPTAVWR